MDHPRHDLLAGPGRPGDQHAGPGRRDPLDLSAQLMDRAGFAGQLEKVEQMAVSETRTDYEECLACQ